MQGAIWLHEFDGGGIFMEELFYRWNEKILQINLIIAKKKEYLGLFFLLMSSYKKEI